MTLAVGSVSTTPIESAPGLDADIEVEFGRFHLDVSVSVPRGRTAAIMGPSGAGKSTLLAAIAGVGALHAGRVSVAGRVVDERTRPRVHVPAARRGVVMLGQEPRLFPHLTARENVAFGPRAKGTDKATARGDADEWLWRVGLSGLGDAHPSALSGGQQQRVAVARALATSPAVLLLDEPLTSLDPETAAGIRAMLHEQLALTHTTALIATHDAVDALALAQQLVIVEDGRVTQRGAVRQVLAAPESEFVASIAGLNRIVGVARAGRFARDSLTLLATDRASVAILAHEGSKVSAVFSPGDVTVARVEATTWTAALRLSPSETPGEWITAVQRLEQTPAGVRVRTPLCAADISLDAAAELELAPGVPVRLHVDTDRVRLHSVPGAPE